MSDINIRTNASNAEQENRGAAARLFRECPIPDNELLANAGLFQKRQELTKTLFFDDLYRNHISKVHGSLLEFGVRWGQNLVTLNNLRGIYEPFNHNRKLLGFDTFEGFVSLSEKDGNDASIEQGAFSVSEGYEAYLEQLLSYHESESPLSHIRKFELHKGDASKTFKAYSEAHPELIVAFAYFDFDVYEPTKDCLETLKRHLTKGSVVGFDELNDRGFPGETIALNEVFGLNKVRIQRSKFSGMQSYFIYEG